MIVRGILLLLLRLLLCLCLLLLLLLRLLVVVWRRGPLQPHKPNPLIIQVDLGARSRWGMC
jgi:hypothetical protein